MFDYSLGGQERKGNDANEAIADIQNNRTLFVQKLTNDPALKPEIVHGLKNVEEVFGHYKPTVDVSFEDAEGSGKDETLNFKNLGDFGKKGITNQSSFLQDLNGEFEDYSKVAKQLKSNKILQKMLTDPAAKAAYVAALRAMLQELEDAEK